MTNPSDVDAEYPCCHQLVGRPHTDYCNDQVMTPCAYPHLDHDDGRGCETDDCPRHGGGE